MQEGSYSFENYADTGNSPFDKLIDLTHECTIQQFASTVINYNHLEGLNLLRLNNEEEFSLNEIIIHSLTPHYNGNPHRAPPSII